jgi:hypothetical protein
MGRAELLVVIGDFERGSLINGSCEWAILLAQIGTGPDGLGFKMMLA